MSKSTAADGILRGQARGFQERLEPGYQGQGTLIRTFRVERYDEFGNRLPPVPVEMRARRFDGFINEGDDVEIADPWTPGSVLQPKSVTNLTTNVVVKPHVDRVPRAFKIFLMFVIFVIGAVILSLITFASRF